MKLRLALLWPEECPARLERDGNRVRTAIRGPDVAALRLKYKSMRSLVY